MSKKVIFVSRNGKEYHKGDIEKNYETVQHHERFNLADILEMSTYWRGVKITLIDGTMFETSVDECEIYFR